MDETALPHASRVSLDRAASLDGRRSLSLEMLTALDDVDLEGGPCEEMASKTSSGAASKEGATGAPAPGSGRDGSIDEATATSAAAVPLSLEWRQLSAFVRVPDLSAQRRRCAALRSTPTKRRQILFGVSGSIEPGVMLGVLGPSGSGKTSLLSILGRRSDAEVTGSILVNGAPGMPKAVRRRIGFVTQDDLMWTSLTVMQTLQFAAELRLPQSMSRDAKRARVDEIIAMLQLEKCSATQIGGAFQRGVSGGERKRTSIAVELLTQPALLLLDEPTSGLDSTIAARLVATLHGLAASHNRAFVVTIHQPATRVFKSFDDIFLLSEGRVMFRGPPGALGTHFSGLGAIQPPDTNPADWLLDLASGEASIGGDATRVALLAAYAEAHPPLPAAPDEDETHVYGRRERSGPLTCIFGRVSSSKDATGSKPAAAPPQLPRAAWPTTFAKQVRVLVRRNFAARAEGVFDNWRLGQVLAVALLSGLLWLHVGRTEHTAKGMGDVSGLLFFELLFLVFLSMFGALFAFPQERAITIKERRGGWFRLSSYYVARCLADLPLDVVIPSGFVIILYWMAGLRAVVFVPHLLIVLLAVLVATSLGLLISAVLMELKQAQAFASVFTLATMLCGGFYIQNVPGWLEWLKWLSFITHAYAATLKLQFPSNSTYECSPGSATRCRVRGSVRLAAIDWDLPAWGNVVILLGELSLLRLATYYALRWRLR